METQNQRIWFQPKSNSSFIKRAEISQQSIEKKHLIKKSESKRADLTEKSIKNNSNSKNSALKLKSQESQDFFEPILLRRDNSKKKIFN